MSIRPVDMEGFPETSFEDMETTFGRENFSPQPVGNSTSPLRNTQAILPTPTSASSGGTTFSNSKGKRLSLGSSSRTDEETEEEEEDFLNDFQEFQGKKDELEDAFRTFFNVKESGGDNMGNIIERDFDEKLNLGSPKRTSRLKQQKSMLELKPHHFKSTSSFSRLPNSLSAGDLRIRSNASVRFKKSMPTLSSNFNGMIQEEDENEVDIPTLKRPHNFLNNFEEAREDEDANDKDFIFDESLIQPQFLSKAPESSPLKLSPSQYDIVRDDTLLTPRLHRRHRDWNSKDQLDSFKERRKNLGRRKSYHNQRPHTASRIQIIKQEIDQNTPIKNGRMYYNPKTMKWEGNEQVLDKFRVLDSQDEKPLLIRTRTSINELQPVEWNAEKLVKKASRNKLSNNRRVVGKMMFDEDNLKWVNTEKDAEADPFANVEDVAPMPGSPGEDTLTVPNSKHISPFLRSQSQLLPSSLNALDRLNSSATTRYHSVGVMRADNGNADPQFQLNSKQLERFWHEENKWNRKVGTWFIMGDSDGEASNLTDLNEVKNSRSFMYEIRNMVLNSTR